MTRLIDQTWFSSIMRPSRYLGGEVNAVTKDPSEAEVSIALCFPDIYDVGMSHLGLKILYSILNSRPWLAAERVFAPWSDLEEAMRSSGPAKEKGAIPWSLQGDRHALIRNRLPTFSTRSS
ncbi:MAG: hypothetical protein B1H13_02575 [Desulfobacteraceae bacterium 4484_190.3]|nr:MAG: hypothetical protein B1H13_02575 [Desulfobacteraceae bacterium 4484_190.3]